jgi:hypothetical protein
VLVAHSHNNNAKESKNPDDVLMEDDGISGKTAQMGTKVDYIVNEL